MHIPFIGGSYKARSSAVNMQECVNWYLESYSSMGDIDQIYGGLTKKDAKSQKVLLPTPGLKLFVTGSASGAVRGIYTAVSDRLFAIMNNKLVEYNKYGKEYVRGTLKTKIGPVNMADNGEGSGRGRGLILTDGIYGYMLNLTDNTFTEITDPAFPACTHVIFLDGYFVVNKANTQQVWCSQPYNGLDWGDITATTSSTTSLDVAVGQKTLTVDKGLDLTLSTDVTLINTYATMKGGLFSYDPLTGTMVVNVTEIKGSGNYNAWVVAVYTGSTSYASAEGSPDNIVSLATIHDELFVVGTDSIEIWYNAGQPGFPFQRIHGGFMNNGTIAPQSVANNGSNLFWLGSSAAGHGQVWTTSSYQPQKISTTSIDYEIESLPNIQDAIGWCYTQMGHGFYVISFVEGKRTFVYDLSNGEWHERSYWNPKNGGIEAHRAICSTFAFGEVLVGDRENQNIYILDLETFIDNGDPIRRVRTGPHIHNDRKRLYFKEFEIDIERGVGLDGIVNTGINPEGSLGKNPQAFLTWSDDGGRTFSNEYWASLGAIGEYKTRLHWHRLGMSRDRIFRLVCTDPVKIVLVDARADVGSEV